MCVLSLELHVVRILMEANMSFATPISQPGVMKLAVFVESWKKKQTWNEFDKESDV